MSPPWRLLLSGAVSPTWAMSVDDALLEAGAAPTLRLYRWSPHGVSLGYFQRWGDFDHGALARAGVPVVRRLTGGGAIFHGDEVTFSLTAPASARLFGGTVRDSYCRVHAVLTEALATLGLANVAPRGADRLLSEREGSPWCFHESTDFDLVSDARKLVGSAQRRTAGRILHHGSLVLRANPWTPEVASLEALGGDADPAHVENALASAFARALDDGLAEAPLTAAETARARAAETSRYADPAWTRRR